MGASLDLDKLRAARLEAKGDGPTVTFGGEEFQLAAEVSAEVLEALVVDNLVGFGQALFGEDYDRAKELGLSRDDLVDLMKNLGVLYGVNQGESSASGTSSKSTGTRSRRASNGSTTSA